MRPGKVADFSPRCGQECKQTQEALLARSQCASPQGIRRLGSDSAQAFARSFDKFSVRVFLLRGRRLVLG